MKSFGGSFSGNCLVVQRATFRSALTGSLLVVAFSTIGRAATESAPVAAPSAASEFSFARRILPILTHAGCNAGACHGAATGQGGFKLSLLGYDPEFDYQSITHELGGRRIDFGAPERSLFLRKPTRQLEHEGGRRIGKDSEAYRTLLDWLASGAAYGVGDLQLTGIEVSPTGLLLLSRGQSHPLQVKAHWSDGTTEDVTRLALYSAQDDAVATVERSGRVTVQQRGVTSIMIRYLGQVAAVRVGAAYQDKEHRWRPPPVRNFIDELAQAEWKRLRLPPSPLADEVTLFRRTHLDVAGRLPTLEEVRPLLGSRASSARAASAQEELVNRLFQSREFVDFWTSKLSDWLLLSSKKMGPRGALAYQEWLRAQVARNSPLDQVVRDLLTAQGESAEVGPVNFHKFASDPRDLGEFVGQFLLGTRIACARCHNHPFDRWTMEDYHRLAAYFARNGFEKERLIQRQVGEVQHPKTGAQLEPRPLGAGTSAAPSSADRRIALAQWLTAPDNTFFAPAMVNRVWKELMGRGLVEPVDDLRPTNPASIPALLEALSVYFIKQRYDLRELIRTIVCSSTYALASEANALNRADEQFFSRNYLRPLTGQVLADAIAQATGVPDDFPGYPPGTRAVALLDPQVPSYSLDVFGRCPRATACDAASSPGGGLALALHLVNGPAINSKTPLAVERLMKEASDSRLEALYLQVLSRRPTSRERAHWRRTLATADSEKEALEDLLWALLNSREFAFNH